MGSCASLKPRGTVRGGCPGCSNEPVEGEPITPADHSKAGLAACPVPNHGEDIIALTAASGTVLGRLNPDRPVSPPIKTEYLPIGFPSNYSFCGSCSTPIISLVNRLFTIYIILLVQAQESLMFTSHKQPQTFTFTLAVFMIFTTSQHPYIPHKKGFCFC